MAYIPAIAAGSILTNMANSLNNKSDSLDSKVEGYRRDQMQCNISMAREVSGQGKVLEHLKSDSDDHYRRHEKVRSNLADTNLRLERYGSDMTYLAQNQDRHNSQMVAFQDQLGSTSSRVELAHSRADDLHHRQNELSLDHRQTNQRMDQLQRDHNKAYSDLAERTVANHERQLHFMDSQKSTNEKLFARTDALVDKQYALEGKFEQVNYRADTLRDGQDRIYSDIRLERKINEDRLQEQTKHTQSIIKQTAAVEQKQICFIDQQKTHNDQIDNRTETIREKLGEASKKIDFVNFRVDNVHSAQQKAEHEQKERDRQFQELSKKVDAQERLIQELLAEQKQTNELIRSLVAQIAGNETRTKSVEHRLESLQADHVKLEVAVGSVGKKHDEP